MHCSVPNDNTVQIYNPRQTDLSKKFKRAFYDFASGLSCKPVEVNDASHSYIQTQWPLCVLCQNHSRIGTDVQDVVEKLQEEGTLDYSKVCIVVFHGKEKHALPITMPTDILTGEEFRKYGLLVDIAFSETIYDCDMNTTARSKIERFLGLFITTPSAIETTERVMSKKSKTSYLQHGIGMAHGIGNWIGSFGRNRTTHSENKLSKQSAERNEESSYIIMKSDSSILKTIVKETLIEMKESITKSLTDRVENLEDELRKKDIEIESLKQKLDYLINKQEDFNETIEIKVDLDTDSTQH